MNTEILTKSIRVLLFCSLLAAALVFAKPFLVPLVFAALFAMLLFPLTQKLQHHGLNNGLACFISLIVLMCSFALIIYLLSWQIGDTVDNFSKLEKNISTKIAEFKNYFFKLFGISKQAEQNIIQQEASTASSIVAAIVSSVGTIITNFVLVLVYTFLFVYFRRHLKQFILMLVRKDEQANAREIIESCRQVSQKYLTGLAIMIACLWVMYGIGFTIVGVRNAIFFAILCGLLEMVPFVGNLTGSLLTAFMVMAYGGSPAMVIGVLITYAVVQFLQSYFLEPLVVGRGVDINPLVTIAGIVAGELIWGIPGMIVAIPMLAITKIICDHVEPLKPYGYFLGPQQQPGKVLKKK